MSQLKVAMPVPVVTGLVVQARAPGPELTARLTVDGPVLTAFPLASSTVTTGLKVAPAALLAGWVVKTRWVADPALMVYGALVPWIVVPCGFCEVAVRV